MRTAIRRTLGILWIADAVLQLQPLMFTMDMVTNVMKPLLTHQPLWLLTLLTQAVNLFSAHLLLGNVLVAAIQMLVGLLLLFQPTARAGLIISIIWGMGIWILGEGMGGLLTGQASLFSGAPGSALLYVLWALFLLHPRSQVRDKARRLVEWGLAALFAAGAVMQSLPGWWTQPVLFSQIDSNLTATTVPQPHWVQVPILWIMAAVQQHPVQSNGVIILICALLGAAWAMRWPARTLLATASLIWLLAIWWLGEGFGMLLVGMSTDPNTAPLIALGVLAVFMPSSQRTGQLGPGIFPNSNPGPNSTKSPLR